MITPQYTLDLNNEIIIDNFAGGGGASTGIEQALGRHVDVAINHDPQAISMHQANHPQTQHYCENVWEVDPRQVHPGRKIGLLWLSPDCKHHSKAKGGKPVEKNIRALAWVALRWAAIRKPRIIMLENVEEFRKWGPLVKDENGDHRPCKKREGREFNAYVNALRRHGYTVEWRELRRIAKGIMRYVVNAAEPFIVPLTHHGADRRTGLGEPIPTVTAAHRGEMALVAPVISTYYGDKHQNDVRGIRMDQPLHTQTTENRHALVSAFMAKHYGGVVGHGLHGEPLHTVTSSDHNSLVTSNLVKMRGTNTGQADDEPLHTISAQGQHFAEVRAFLVKYYGNEQDGISLHEPNHTVTARDRFCLVTVHGEEYAIEDIGLRMLAPRELYRAQGFPEDYIIDRGLHIDADGTHHWKPMTKTAQVRMCGNSVCPPLAAALVRANCADMMIRKDRQKKA